MLSYLPLAHVAERALVEHGLLATGMEVFFAESLDTFSADLQRARPTVFFSVPRLWVKFQQGVFAKMPPAKARAAVEDPAAARHREEEDPRRARPRPMRLRRRRRRAHAARAARLVRPPGPADHRGLRHDGELRRLARHAARRAAPPGTVGLPYEGVQSRLDPANGEIQMKSPGLMLGYYKEEALTRQTFTPDGWLHTGDKGRLESDGYLRITGRVKDLFKTSKGKYVAPAPIEDRLVMHASVGACVVTGANLGQPVGIVMLNAEAVQQARDAARRGRWKPRWPSTSRR